ncbi:hypothetical protein V493_02375 [Pseudogymnoascus sp. VKM F-4281 (FW-2241)]|nr:hypothetical protein V493_02375 [Pseudogymnoascus sp. VKM F-4281 (FW-2241)]
MVTPRTPERAMIRRDHNAPPHTEPKLFLDIRALQTLVQDRWQLELVRLLLYKLPPAQPPLPSILPQFNLGQPPQPPQPLQSSPTPPRIIPRRRTTQAKASDFDEPQPAPTFVPVYERHNRRLADLKDQLSPLTCGNDGSDGVHNDDDSGCVLLCWGSSYSCRMLAVNHIGSSIDQELFWNKLQTAWYDTRGEWRQKMPWYRIRNVKQVEIRLVGPDPNAKDLFYGVYQPADKFLETKKQRLQESVSTFSETLEPEQDDYNDYVDYDDYYENDLCWYDSMKGSTVHVPWNCAAWNCAAWEEFPVSTCPVEDFHENQKRLMRLKMEPLRTLLFQNPNMAVYNELDNAELVHSSKSIRDQYQGQHCPSLGQLVFRGLHIEDGWTFDATIPAIFMPLAAVVSILIVLIAWLVYGDWGVAWNVGACFIPLLTGLGSWLLHVKASG